MQRSPFAEKRSLRQIGRLHAPLTTNLRNRRDLRPLRDVTVDRRIAIALGLTRRRRLACDERRKEEAQGEGCRRDCSQSAGTKLGRDTRGHGGPAWVANNGANGSLQKSLSAAHLRPNAQRGTHRELPQVSSRCAVGGDDVRRNGPAPDLPPGLSVPPWFLPGCLGGSCSVRLVGVANGRTSHGFFIAAVFFMRSSSRPPESTTGLKIAKSRIAIMTSQSGLGAGSQMACGKSGQAAREECESGVRRMPARELDAAR